MTILSIITTILVAFITAVIGPIAVEIARTKLSKHNDIVQNAIDSGNEINSILHSLREYINADRIYLLSFHNGSHLYPSGTPMAKFSIINESVGVGINTIKLEYKDIPVNLFSKSISTLMQDGEAYITDLTNKDELIRLNDKYALSADIFKADKSVYYFAIRDMKHQKMLGMMGIDFCKEITKLSQTEMEICRERAIYIGGLLDKYLKNK